MLVTWLSTLFSGVGHILLLWCLDTTWKRAFFFPEFSCSHCPASTSCLVFLPILPVWLLANQHLFKTYLTEYRIVPHEDTIGIIKLITAMAKNVQIPGRSHTSPSTIKMKRLLNSCMGISSVSISEVIYKLKKKLLSR